MPTLRIHSRLKIIGVNPYVMIRLKKASSLKRNWRGPMPVRFHVNGSNRIWRLNLMPVGDGSFRLYLNGEIRRGYELRVGDLVTVDVQFDDDYKAGPQHPVPYWFGDELALDSIARHRWDLLTPSLKKEILRYFGGLKTPEAKRRNLTRALRILRGEEGRFLGRTWNGNDDPRKRST